MKSLKLITTVAGMLLGAAFSLPAAAQATYNFAGTSGGSTFNCDFPSNNPCNIASPNATQAKTLTLSGYSNTGSGGTFATAVLSDQGGSGIGAGGEASSPDHAIDNNTNTEFVLLNFGTNKVVLTGWETGWSNTDSDVAILRWNGADSPVAALGSQTTASLLSSGWSLVANADMDGSANATGDVGLKSATTNIAVNSGNASSWWIVSSYFGGGTLTADTQKDYFKLLSVTAQCVGNTSGGACNTVPTGGGVPEPGSLALAGLALLGVFAGRRRGVVSKAA